MCVPQNLVNNFVLAHVDSDVNLRQNVRYDV